MRRFSIIPTIDLVSRDESAMQVRGTSRRKGWRGLVANSIKVQQQCFGTKVVHYFLLIFTDFSQETVANRNFSCQPLNLVDNLVSYCIFVVFTRYPFGCQLQLKYSLSQLFKYTFQEIRLT